MQQKDQENGVTPKKHWKALTQGSGVTNSSADSPSVASRSAAFESNTRDEQKVKNVLWPYSFYSLSNKNCCSGSVKRDELFIIKEASQD